MLIAVRVPLFPGHLRGQRWGLFTTVYFHLFIYRKPWFYSDISNSNLTPWVHSTFLVHCSFSPSPCLRQPSSKCENWPLLCIIYLLNESPMYNSSSIFDVISWSPTSPLLLILYYFAPKFQYVGRFPHSVVIKDCYWETFEGVRKSNVWH